jgi:hypothetical protein
MQVLIGGKHVNNKAKIRFQKMRAIMRPKKKIMPQDAYIRSKSSIKHHLNSEILTSNSEITWCRNWRWWNKRRGGDGENGGEPGQGCPVIGLQRPRLLVKLQTGKQVIGILQKSKSMDTTIGHIISNKT